MRRLFTWKEQELIGFFEEHVDGAISFEYSEGAVHSISQSLPIDGVSKNDAARNYLLNLVPESDLSLSRLYVERNVSRGDIFGILDGMDAVGGLVYSLAEEPPTLSLDGVRPYTPELIAAQIASLHHTGVGVPAVPMRFSLAGAQAKFAMSRIDGDWYIPSCAIPSTHIIKIASKSFDASRQVEIATMDLARACGFKVAAHGEIEALGQHAYITERFDRKNIGTWACERLHIEDFAQAMGVSPNEKYDQTLEDVIAMIKRCDASEDVVYDFLAAFMFNAYCGNADAHIKNYSFVYDGDNLCLSPLYDAIATSCWPGLDNSLPITLNDVVFYAEYLSESAWVDFAINNGLDDCRVVDMARDIATMVEGNMAEFFAEIPQQLRDRALQHMRKCTTHILTPNKLVESEWVPLYDKEERLTTLDQMVSSICKLSKESPVSSMTTQCELPEI